MHFHHVLARWFVDRGGPPTVRELTAALGRDVRPELAALAADHGVVLDGAGEVAIVHPFAAPPGGVRVAAGDRAWSAPCLWCAMGVVTLVAPDATLDVRFADDATPSTIRVTGAARLEPAGVVVHFPTPPRRAWDDVVAWCASVRPFRGAGQVAAWCAHRGVAAGATVPLEQVLELGRVWYARHLDEDWRKWTVAEAQAIFARVGLVGEFWALPASDGRF